MCIGIWEKNMSKQERKKNAGGETSELGVWNKFLFFNKRRHDE